MAGMLAVLVGRVWDRHRLVAAGGWWELRLGERVSRPALETFVRTLAGGLPRRLFGSAPWVALSVSSQEDRAACGLFISGGLSPAQVRAAVEQALGGVTVEAENEDLPNADGGVCWRVASLAPVGSRFLPLRVDHRVDPAGQLLASLRAQQAGEGGVVQLVLQAPARSASRRARSQAARLRAGRGLQSGLSLRALDWLGSSLGGMLDVLTPSSPHPMGRQAPVRAADPFSLERARAIDAKAGTLLLAATLRVGASASGRRRARGRLGGLLAAFGQYQELGGLRRRWEPFCAQRLARCLPPVKPRLLLSSGEAAALIAVPEESALAPVSFTEAPSRRIAPVAQAPSRGLLLGRSDHSGFDREVRVEPRALLQHAHVLGPTGRGKSTLLLNMTVEAIRAGMGGMVLDPTGELTGLILAASTASLPTASAAAGALPTPRHEGGRREQTSTLPRAPGGNAWQNTRPPSAVRRASAGRALPVRTRSKGLLASDGRTKAAHSRRRNDRPRGLCAPACACLDRRRLGAPGHPAERQDRQAQALYSSEHRSRIDRPRVKTEDQVRSPRGGAGGLFTRRARASGSSRPDAAVALARNTHRHSPPGRAAEWYSRPSQPAACSCSPTSWNSGHWSLLGSAAGSPRAASVSALVRSATEGRLAR
jgi:hypothetical protein